MLGGITVMIAAVKELANFVIELLLFIVTGEKSESASDEETKVIQISDYRRERETIIDEPMVAEVRKTDGAIEITLRSQRGPVCERVKLAQEKQTCRVEFFHPKSCEEMRILRHTK